MLGTRNLHLLTTTANVRVVQKARRKRGQGWMFGFWGQPAGKPWALEGLAREASFPRENGLSSRRCSTRGRASPLVTTSHPSPLSPALEIATNRSRACCLIQIPAKTECTWPQRGSLGRAKVCRANHVGRPPKPNPEAEEGPEEGPQRNSTSKLERGCRVCFVTIVQSLS